jgi:hypothetical protein
MEGLAHEGLAAILVELAEDLRASVMAAVLDPTLDRLTAIHRFVLSSRDAPELSI